MLARMQQRVHTARLAWLHAARLRDAGQPFGTAAALAKLTALDGLARPQALAEHDAAVGVVQRRLEAPLGGPRGPRLAWLHAARLRDAGQPFGTAAALAKLTASDAAMDNAVPA
jgi:alkylation response protein AidB-like acyl-CoA dehydrogenase